MNQKPRAIVTIGIPGSGKSTFAKEFMRNAPEGETWWEINRDETRMALFGLEHYHDYKFTKKSEKEVTESVYNNIRKAAEYGHNVIISDTNLNPTHRSVLIDQLETLGFEVELKVFHIDFETAVKRDEKRKDKTVGRQVIWNFYQRYLEYTMAPRYTPNHDLPTAFIFDIDGTLATMEDSNGVRHRSPYDWASVGDDFLQEHVWIVMRALWEKGYRIILLSGRDSVCRKETEEWLKKHHICYTSLHMREEGNNEKDSILKQRLFFDEIAPYYNVKGVFDDRAQVCRMWYNIGVPLFRVGDPMAEF